MELNHLSRQGSSQDLLLTPINNANEKKSETKKWSFKKPSLKIPKFKTNIFKKHQNFNEEVSLFETETTTPPVVKRKNSDSGIEFQREIYQNRDVMYGAVAGSEAEDWDNLSHGAMDQLFQLAEHGYLDAQWKVSQICRNAFARKQQLDSIESANGASRNARDYARKQQQKQQKKDLKKYLNAKFPGEDFRKTEAYWLYRIKEQDSGDKDVDIGTGKTFEDTTERLNSGKMDRKLCKGVANISAGLSVANGTICGGIGMAGVAAIVATGVTATAVSIAVPVIPIVVAVAGVGVAGGLYHKKRNESKKDHAAERFAKADHAKLNKNINENREDIAVVELEDEFGDGLENSETNV